MSIHQNRTGKWECRYREGTRNRSKTFTRKADAQRFDTEQKYRREVGERVVRAKDAPILRDFAQDWLKRRARAGIAENTSLMNASTLDKHVLPVLGHLRLTDLTVRRLLAWQDHMVEQGSSHYMLNRAREVLGQLLRSAAEQEYVGVNTALLIPRLSHETREGRTASPQQVEGIRSYFLDRDRLGYATMISVLAYVGLRPAELLGVQWSALHGNQLTIDSHTVNGSLAKGTKTGKPRFPSLPAPVMADLAEWRQDTAFIFPRSKDGLPWRKTDWDNWRKRWFRPAIESVGIEDFVPYDLRHTCASLMIRAGVPLLEISADLGHGVGVLTETYAHDIQAMRGQPSRPVEAEIAAARGGDVQSIRKAAM